MNAPHILLTVISIDIIYDLIGNYSLNEYSPLFTDISPDLASDESFKDLSADSPARIEDSSPSGNRLDGWQPAD